MNTASQSPRVSPYLTRSTSRNVLALGASLTTCDGDTRPSPVSAAARSTENVDISSVALHGAGNLLEGDVRDLDTVGWGTSGAAILVILLNNESVLGDTGKGDILELDVGDSTGGIVDGLDTNTVLGVDNLRVGDGHVFDSIVATTTNGADGETMATITVAVGEGDVLQGC